MTININQVREDTPACKKLLHFNNAGASLMPNPVFEAVTEHLELERNIGGYEAAELATQTLEGLYTNIARLINCQPGEIAYVENATRAWDMAFYSLPLKAGDEILTHSSEYASNYLAYLQQAQRRQLVIKVVPSDSTGQIDVDALESMITNRTRLISLNHIPTQSGLVNSAEEVGSIARRHGIFYLLDACQSVGQMPVDVEKIGCDLLSATGRKFLRGPRGTGFLYVRQSILEKLEPPFIDLRSGSWIDQNNYVYAPGARRFENWESYVAGRAGLSEAINYALTLGLENIETRVFSLAARLRNQLSNVEGITVHDPGRKPCGITTFFKKTEEAEDLVKRLRAENINTSFTTPASARMDDRFEGLGDFTRASVHYFNTDAEIDRFCDFVAGTRN